MRIPFSLVWIGALALLSVGAARTAQESPSPETLALVENLKLKIRSERLDVGEEARLTLTRYTTSLSVCYYHKAPDGKREQGCFRKPLP